MIDTLGDLPLGPGADEVAELLWQAGFPAHASGAPDLAARAWERVVEHRRQTLSADHRLLLEAQSNLAAMRNVMGDYEGARTLEEAVVETLRRTLPPDDPQLTLAQENLAATLAGLGDLEAARKLQEEVLAGVQGLYPEGHHDRLKARQGLATTLFEMGAVDEARAQYEEILRLRERYHGEDWSALSATRMNLVVILETLGEHEDAHALQTDVLATLEARLPPDHPDLFTARSNMVTLLQGMGELEEALAIQRVLLEIRLDSLPRDHPQALKARAAVAATLLELRELEAGRVEFEALVEDAQRVRPPGDRMLLSFQANLAAAMAQLGDLEQARALQEHVLASTQATLELDDPAVHTAMENLAACLAESGHLHRARVLQEDLLARRRRLLPEQHPSLLNTLANLAGTIFKMGDTAGARALFEAVLAAQTDCLPATHPLRLDALHNLATVLHVAGELELARELIEELIEASRDAFHPGHPYLLKAERLLVASLLHAGEGARALALAQRIREQGKWLGGQGRLEALRDRSLLAAALRASGQLEEAADEFAEVRRGTELLLPRGHLDRLICVEQVVLTQLLLGHEDEARATARGLAEEMLTQLELALELSPREVREAIDEGAQRHAAVRQALAGGSEEDLSLRFQLVETLRAAAASPHSRPPRGTGGELAEVRAKLGALVLRGPGSVQTEAEFKATVERLALERDRLERAAREEANPPATEGFTRITPGRMQAALEKDSALVGYHRIKASRADGLRDGAARDRFWAHVLAPEGRVRELDLGPADELAAAVARWRGLLASGSLPRGVGLPRTAGVFLAGEEALLEEGRQLRRLYVDPVLEAVGDVQTLHVVLDDALVAVPLEALPLDEEGAFVGDAVRICHEVSFARLDQSQLGQPLPRGGLLCVGGIDYGPPSGEEALLVLDQRSGLGGFGYLPGTRSEALAVGKRFESALDLPPTLLSGQAATKESFLAQAPAHRFLHVATHGWFAPEETRSTLDLAATPAQIEAGRGRSTVEGMAPWTLCGLAFAGANRGRDDLGRMTGILTAEELSGLDLSGCELAVLSACETNVGVQRAGQGIQSLQTALHAAGARTAISSLWKVDDEATHELFDRFYASLWQDGLGKAEALWRAKVEMRASGHPVRHWAAWVLSGHPD